MLILCYFLVFLHYCFVIKGHYSVKKSAIVMGLGTEGVVSVKSDARLGPSRSY